jgi:hypothetical protein
MGNSGTWSHNSSVDLCWSAAGAFGGVLQWHLMAAVATGVRIVDWIGVGVLLEGSWVCCSGIGWATVATVHWIGVQV